MGKATIFTLDSEKSARKQLLTVDFRQSEGDLPTLRMKPKPLLKATCKPPTPHPEIHSTITSPSHHRAPLSTPSFFRTPRETPLPPYTLPHDPPRRTRRPIAPLASKARPRRTRAARRGAPSRRRTVLEGEASLRARFGGRSHREWGALSGAEGTLGNRGNGSLKG